MSAIWCLKRWMVSGRSYLLLSTCWVFPWSTTTYDLCRVTCVRIKRQSSCHISGRSSLDRFKIKMHANESLVLSFVLITHSSRNIYHASGVSWTKLEVQCKYTPKEPASLRCLWWLNWLYKVAQVSSHSKREQYILLMWVTCHVLRHQWAIHIFRFTNSDCQFAVSFATLHPHTKTYRTCFCAWNEVRHRRSQAMRVYNRSKIKTMIQKCGTGARVFVNGSWWWMTCGVSKKFLTMLQILSGVITWPPWGRS